MQKQTQIPDYPSVDNPLSAAALEAAATNGHHSVLEPYKPPGVPHGLPHVVNFATISSMNLPIQIRFLIIILARFANYDGVASVAVATLCEICEIGSKNTVERWLDLAAQVGVLRKEPNRGGKDRKSNSYTFLGKSRNWVPLPVGHPETVPIIALAEARHVIEQLQVKAARVDDLETEVEQLRAELALLRNGGAIGHPKVIDGVDDTSEPALGHSYETRVQADGQENDQAIGHCEVTNGPLHDPSHSYENADPASPEGNHGAIGHSEVTNGPTENPSEEASHSYEKPYSSTSLENHGAIGHSEVTNGSEEGQEYLARRSRVETLVQQHRNYYERSFDRRGVLGAIEFFSRSPENEQELIRQVKILDTGGDPRKSGTDPPVPAAGHPETEEEPDRYAVGDCPDCGRPFGTYGGARYCTDCTERRRRESEH